MARLVITAGLFGILLAGVILFLIFRPTPPREAVAAVPVQATNVSPIPAPSLPEAAPVGASLSEGAALTQITFDSPQENESVPRTFQVSGHCGPMPRGQHLLLAIQTGRVFSPKWPPIQVRGDTWTGSAREYGVRSGGSFTLCVFQVNDAGLDEIARWDADGVKTRRWPPFYEVPGGRLLASMKLRVATQPKP